MTVGNRKATAPGLYSGPIPSNGVIYVSNGACEEETVLTLHRRLPGNLRLRQRLRQRRKLLGPIDDRRPERHHHQRQPDQKQRQQRHAGPDRQQLRPHLPPLLQTTAGSARRPARRSRRRRRRMWLSDPTTEKYEAARMALARSKTSKSMPRSWRSNTRSSSITTTAARPSETSTSNGRSPRNSADRWAPVQRHPSSGYLKNYVYDNRLHYLEPPSFIDPKPSNWVIGRETLG